MRISGIIFVFILSLAGALISFSQEKQKDSGKIQPESKEDIWSLFNEKTPNLKTSQALFRGFNKVNAKPKDFWLNVNQDYYFGSLRVVLKHCEKTPPEEAPESYAFVEIYEKPLINQKKKQSEPKKIRERKIEKKNTGIESKKNSEIENQKLQEKYNYLRFSGWMFASNPGLNAFEHPIYDFWLIGCKTASIEGSLEK